MTLIVPTTGRGRRRPRHLPDQPAVGAEAMLDRAPWWTVRWRRGQGMLAAPAEHARRPPHDRPPSADDPRANGPVPALPPSDHSVTSPEGAKVVLVV